MPVRLHQLQKPIQALHLFSSVGDDFILKISFLGLLFSGMVASDRDVVGCRAALYLSCSGVRINLVSIKIK